MTTTTKFEVTVRPPAPAPATVSFSLPGQGASCPNRIVMDLDDARALGEALTESIERYEKGNILRSVVYAPEFIKRMCDVLVASVGLETGDSACRLVPTDAIYVAIACMKAVAGEEDPT